jgi:hypothetical protein
MTSTAERTPACGDGAALTEALERAAAVGCTIGTGDTSVQLERVATLRRHVTRLERRRGFLAIAFDGAADRDSIERFIEVERGCCSFLTIELEHLMGETRLVFSSDDPEREPALAAIAGIFDPSGSPGLHPEAESRTRTEKTLLGILGLACLVCLLPVLLAAGAAGSLAAALGGSAVVAASVAVLVAAGVLWTLARRRSRHASCGC